MIAKTVEYICKELNFRYDDPATASLQDFAVLGNVARLDTDTDASQAEMVRNVVMTLVNIEEEQSHLLAGGIPRKQGFSLEFVSYGNDLQNV